MKRRIKPLLCFSSKMKGRVVPEYRGLGGSGIQLPGVVFTNEQSLKLVSL